MPTNVTAAVDRLAKTWANTRVSARLGITYPIIQGPLGGFLSQRLTAAVSNYGGLGSFGAHGLAPSAIKDVIAELRSMTDKPFAMNLWVSMEDDGARTSDEAAFNRSLAPLRAPDSIAGRHTAVLQPVHADEIRRTSPSAHRRESAGV